MERIELARWRRRVVLGSAGQILLDGDGIARKHAAIVVGRNGDGETVQLLRPLDGRVAVRRRGRELAVLGEWQLADGDVLLIGGLRATYRNLGSRPRPVERKGDVSWLQQRS